MTHLRPFHRRLGRMAKLASLAAALGLVAAPLALAGTEDPGGEYRPEGVPPGYTGTENREANTDARRRSAWPARIDSPRKASRWVRQKGSPRPKAFPVGHRPKASPSGRLKEGVAPSATANPRVSQHLSTGAARALGRGKVPRNSRRISATTDRNSANASRTWQRRFTVPLHRAGLATT